MGSKIKEIFAREILDSRGDPTIEVILVLENNLEIRASVPAGASTGKYEAVELRDGDENRFLGRGVLRACQNIKQIIAPALIGFNVTEQQTIDKKMIELDGTPNKSRLGANAILAVSLACARAGAKISNLPIYRYLRQVYNLPFKEYLLPLCAYNIINGGKHAGNKVDVQEFLIIPKRKRFSESLRVAVGVFQALKKIIKNIYGCSVAVGDEGGFAPDIKRNSEGLTIISEAIKQAGYQFGKEIDLGVDIAASTFYSPEKKLYFFEGLWRSAEEMFSIYQNWQHYPVFYLEDPWADDDWLAWEILGKKLIANKDFILVGDDIFVTSTERLKEGIERGVANAVIIKPNQVGTLTETLACIELARRYNYKIIISHRSGETNDDFISDLAVAVNAEFMKAGAPNRGERIAKYNRLLEIEEGLMN
jgi:enolase